MVETLMLSLCLGQPLERRGEGREVILALPREVGEPRPLRGGSSWGELLFPGLSSRAAPTAPPMARAIPVPAAPLRLTELPPTGDRLIDEFASTNDTDGVFRREAGGWRLRTPAPDQPRRAWLYYTDTTYAVGGDFAFEADYDAAKLGSPRSEGNAEISVIGRGRRGHLGLNVKDGPGGPQFGIVRIAPNAGGMHYNILSLPRKSSRGRIALRRQGADLIFLAADGPGLPLRELVRYPHDPLILPNLRVSAFTEGGSADVPVDAAFTNVRVEAGRVVRGPEAGSVPPPPAPPVSYPVTLAYGGRPGAILGDFSRTNDDARAFRAEGDALRLNPPVREHRKGLNTYWYHDSRFTAAGDLEISVRYDLAALGPPANNNGHASVGVVLETETPIGSVSLVRSFSEGRKHHYSSTRYSKHAFGQNWDTQTVGTAGAKSGRLIVRRTGANLALIGIDGDAPPREIFRMPWTPEPIRRIRLLAYQGDDAGTPIDVTLRDLTIKASVLTDRERNETLAGTGPAAPEPVLGATAAPPAEPVVLDTLPRPRSQKWLYLGMGAAVAVGFGALGVVLTRATRRNPKP